MKYSLNEILKDESLPSVRLMTDPSMSLQIFQEGLPLFYKKGLKLISNHPVIRKYKPGKRLVIKYDWTIEFQSERRKLEILSKIYNSDRGGNIYHKINLVLQNTSHLKNPIFSPEIIGYLPHVRMLLQEYIQGKTIRHFLENEERNSKLKLMAHLIGELHCLNFNLNQKKSPEIELARLHSTILSLPSPEEKIKLLLTKSLESLVRCNEKQNKSPYVVIHSDLHHEQMIFTNNHATLIDLDDISMGEPEMDVANLMAHFRLLSLEIYQDPYRLEDVRNVFITEYRNHNKSTFSDERYQFYEAITYIRLICILILKDKKQEWIFQLIKILSTINY